jgi:hypothetical protein
MELIFYCLTIEHSSFLFLSFQLCYFRDPKVYFTKDLCKWEFLAEGEAFCVFLGPVEYPSILLMYHYLCLESSWVSFAYLHESSHEYG